MIFRALFRPLLALLLCLGATLVAAEPYKPGAAIESFTTKDQHEKDYTFTPGTVRVIIVSFDMPSGKKANTYFGKQAATFLDEHQAILINNIYGMPGIGRMFALPKMRDYPHRILLADAEHFLDRFPTKEGKLTVLKLDDKGVVLSVAFIDPAKELAGVFAAK